MDDFEMMDFKIKTRPSPKKEFRVHRPKDKKGSGLYGGYCESFSCVYKVVTSFKANRQKGAGKKPKSRDHR
ncbi:hypothetical protein IT408_04855 [Candidatus Uhrbacteria bacterium]|nr:hypothetical protein [Candidatus Uhrbacteria bacterium]